MSLPSNASEAPCILCDVKINLKERNHACVGLKGLETINNFSVKHNELHPRKSYPFLSSMEANVMYIPIVERGIQILDGTSRQNENEKMNLVMLDQHFVQKEAVFRSALIAAYAAGLLIKLKQNDFLETSITSIAVLCP